MKTKDWFLFDEGNNRVVRFTNSDIICYADFDEAQEDCYGNEKVVKFDELPTEIQVEYINQIK